MWSKKHNPKICMFLYDLRKLLWKLIYWSPNVNKISGINVDNFIPHIHLFFYFLLFLKQEENLTITILTVWTQLYSDVLFRRLQHSMSKKKFNEPTLSGLFPVILKIQFFLQVTEWCNHHNITKKHHLDIFQNVQLVMGLDEYRIPGLNSLTEEMEKKKLTADVFNLFFFNHCVHGLWPNFSHRISYKEFSHENSTYRS